MVWAQLELEAPHIAYACIGIFSTLFSLVSLFVKERLYIGEATVATIAGLIIGPHCLNWFDPINWGNSDFITLEICRIVLCIQIVAVAVELPRKYMKKHWLSVAIFLLPVMTFGWLTVGLFIWALIPHYNFSDGLLVAACVTATDPILAAAVVGKGKFAQRVPGHLRNLLTAESGCNDGMAFPFIFLALNIIIHPHNPGKIIQDWFTLTILWECIFGCILGFVLGFVLRKLVTFAEMKNLIDRESFLAIFVFLAFNSAGIGSMLGVDDLLVSFVAGTAFGWNGDFAKKTEESHVSTVIDLLLNLSFFVYFGAIIPWPQFNNSALGLDVWRLVVLAFVIIFLRRLPAVIAFKPLTPDVKTWREALFCGHFGPIGVGAIFAAILARKDLEQHYTTEETPLAHLPGESFPHYQLLATIWPIVCFIVITSIIVHGSSVAVLTLGKRLNRMAITMSFTTTTGEQTPSWMSRLQKLDKVSTSFSLHRVDTEMTEKKDSPYAEKLATAPSIETSGIKVRPAGGAKRKSHKKRKRRSGAHVIKKTLSRVTTKEPEDGYESPDQQRRQQPATEFLQLGLRPPPSIDQQPPIQREGIPTPLEDASSSEQTHIITQTVSPPDKTSGLSAYGQQPPTEAEKQSRPTVAYQDGDQIIIEDQYGEIMDNLKLTIKPGKIPLKGHVPVSPVKATTPIGGPFEDGGDQQDSIHSIESLQRRLTQYSTADEEGEERVDDHSPEVEGDSSSGGSMVPLRKRISRTLSKKAFVHKSDPRRKKVFAHQVDDLILIENDEGEIIRRYKVNRHIYPPGVKKTHVDDENTSTGGTRTRSGTIVDRMRSLVGLKTKSGIVEEKENKRGMSTPDIRISHYDHDLEDQTRVLTPHEDAEDVVDGGIGSSSKLEEKLTDLLTQQKKKGKRKQSPPPSNRITDSEEEEEDSELSEDSEEEETEIEKRRRLLALGQLRSDNRDEDDEEE
ncbi:CNH1 [[Candida] subhashii]|uniref:CNH1 n=1 Tax=[Candida] subhashii TaxID=561895 RepID=A0A8J5QRJ3_9ASCO|nr:CNH1 [[Candida] subhashii]KAG7665123.1 CNH1 [[Candida] subhashii]